MSELGSDLRREFLDKETRTIYADESLNTYIATQLKVLREQRGWTQAELARHAGMAQPRIALLEDVNYSSWSVNTLRKLAAAFDLRLSVKFDTFSSLLPEIEGLSRNTLERDSFGDDAWFHDTGYQESVTPEKLFRAIRGSQTEFKFTTQATDNLIEMPKRNGVVYEKGAGTSATAATA